ncbi:MAG: hypothetical protein OEO21_04600 [Candidatus Krumholzibacteria bacterium]|nr:hypothetical protein [Candidatus Krumholzibacteria bacterium]
MKTAKLVTSMLLIVAVALAAGCKDNGPVAPSTPTPQPGPQPEDGVDAALVGVWIYTGATSNGRQTELATVLEWEQGTVIAAFEVVEDGFYAYAEFDEDLEVMFYTEGTISTRGNQFTIRADGGSFDGTWSRAGSELKLNYTADGEKISLVAENLDEAEGSPSLTVAR